ncbi:DUF2510 domain-containing protein [Cellulomonas sp. WB94]|uniref:DUF2510 domain-containing protein n=1 Tax=Cellulomonas sp. WB94 TaxID=2173174 RepID=UPI0024130D22|nr:DUF2510 domain-containing protein [Cellulomonas sp. WB94]
MTGGWYDDGVTPGVERWFDGTDWSEHTRPVWVAPVPVAPPAPAAAAYGAAPQGASVQGSPYAQHHPGLGVEGAQPWPGQQGQMPQWPAQKGSMATSGPSDAVHWMLPVGRSWQSITAGYVGLLSLGIWVLGPVAIWLGIWAILKARTGGHGRGRAVFAIITGTLGTLFMGLFLVMRSQS